MAGNEGGLPPERRLGISKIRGFLARAGRNWRGTGSAGSRLHRWVAARFLRNGYLPTCFLHDVFRLLFGKDFLRFRCAFCRHLGAQEGAKSLIEAVPAPLGRTLRAFWVLLMRKSASTVLTWFRWRFSTVFGFENIASEGKKVLKLCKENRVFLLSDFFDMRSDLEPILLPTWAHFGFIFRLLDCLGASWDRLRPPWRLLKRLEILARFWHWFLDDFNIILEAF